MFTNQFLIGTLIAIALEMVVEVLVTKSTPFIFEPYLALIKDTQYLLKTILKSRFFRWLNTQSSGFRWLIKIFLRKRKDSKYVELEALEKQAITYDGTPETLSLLLQKFLSLDESQPFVLIGKPGSGKTTALEVLASRSASKALKRLIIYLGIFLFVILVSSESVIKLLLGFFVYGLSYRYMLQAINITQLIKKFLQRRLRLPPKSTIPLMPIFIDARSGYSGGDVKEWCHNIAKDLLGKRKLHFNQYDGIAWIIDGVNEISASLYPIFIEGWREILKDSPSIPVVFSSRLDQDPSHQLGVENYIKVCSLNDNAIRDFIEISHVMKSDKMPSIQLENQIDTYFLELVTNGLLGENGIGRNPYWLTMILNSDFYTINRGKLFFKYIEELLTREIKKKPEERKRKSIWKNIVPIDIEIYALSNLAYAMYEEGVIGFSTEDGWENARKIIQHCIEDTPFLVDDVVEEAEASSLLMTRYRASVEFVHQLVQEFFVAIYLNNAVNKSSLDRPLLRISETLGESLLRIDLREIIIMLIGISDYQMEIAAWLANQIVEKRHKSSIALLKRCIEIIYETTDKDVSSAVVDIILGSMRDPDIHIRWDTVVVLGEIRNASALEPLIIDLLEPDAFARQDLRKVIENTEYPPINQLISFLNSTNSSVRKNTIEILGKINDDRVIEPILSALNDSDPNVRWQAVYTLGKIGDKSVLSELEQIANTDETFAHSKIRLADTALEAIWNIRNRTEKQHIRV